ncbi:MAG TPA: formyltransferase family protein [Candidatus Dormibacteraeota bacterium]|nr:formyltransferase family protein [Candidatus Dormibacteraeota bacterium]
MRPAPSAALPSPWLEAVATALWALPSFRMVPDLVLAEPPPGHPRSPASGAPRVVFTGFPSHFSVALLLALLQTEVEVVGLVTSPDAHPVVRADNALSQIARHLDIPLLRLRRVNDPESLHQLAALRPDLGFMASFNQILHPAALAIPHLGWINVHPSLLPAYRGPEPVYWAIVNSEAEAGITIQRVARAIDLGPVLWQDQTAIRPDDTNGTLSRRLTALAASALPAVVARALAGDPGTPLTPGTGSYYTSVRHRRLDEAPSAHAAERLVRAGNPNMAAAAPVDGRIELVLRAEVVAPDGAADGPRLRFPDGDLRLLETVPMPD